MLRGCYKQLLLLPVTQVIGDMNLDGAIDHDGSAFNSTVSGDFGVSAATITTASGAILDGLFSIQLLLLM